MNKRQRPSDSVKARKMGSYLLFCLCTRTRPFDNDVLLRFGVGSKSKCDSGEGGALQRKYQYNKSHLWYRWATYKIYANNELCLVTLATLYFGRSATTICMRALRGTGTRTISIAASTAALAIAGRGVVHVIRRVAMATGVNRWGRHWGA